MSLRIWSAVAALGLAAGMQVAPAATVFETTDLVASTPTAAAQLPPPIEFSVTTAGTYVAELSDLALPAPLSTLRAIVTRDLQVVAKVELASGNDTAQAAFAAVAGTYRIHVLGELETDAPAGTFAIRVAPQAGGTALVDTPGVINADSSAPPATATLTIELSIAAAGAYELAVTDQAFPVALAATPLVLLTKRTSSAEITRNTGPFTVAEPGIYDLTIFATAAAADEAGLVSVRVSGGPSAVVVHQSTNRVGRLPAPVDVALPSTGQYSVAIADTGFPLPLTSFAALVAQNAVALGRRSDAGSFPIAGAQGTVQVFTFAKAATVGALSLRLSQGASVIFGDVRPIDASPEANTPAIYSFEPSAAVAAGTYRLTLTDFRFPAALSALHAAVIQRDTIVKSTDRVGDLDVTLVADTVKALVAVEPPAQASSALFGVDLSAAPGGANVFESTQGVGGLFKAYLAPIATAGRYEFRVADLEFPDRLGSSALAVTSGTDLVAQIFGGSNVSVQVAAGTYVLNFIGQPATGKVHGTYGLKVADAAPLPTVTLTANPTTLTAGGRTTLQWTSANATACTATNAWTGSKGTTGTEQSATLNANATFELSCSGPGGSANASAAVTVNAPSAGGGGGGGGGSTGLLLLIYMGSLALARRRGRVNRDLDHVSSL